MSEPEVERVVRRRSKQNSDSLGSEAGSRRSTRSKVLLGGVVAVVALALLVGGGALWGLWSISRIDRVDVKLSDVETPSEPFNMLIVGSDSREKISKNDPSAGGMLGKEAPSGQRSDSLMVARVDLKNSRVDLLSIPRDLWVPIAGKNKEQRINTAYATSAQATVDTIEAQLKIPINHFAEVDFSGFRALVNALGGVPMYFSHPVKDLNSGLNITTKGCTVLDGEQGLAFVRARHLKWHNGSRWVADPTGDLGRMTRQQILTRAAFAKARTMGLKDVTKLKGLVDAAVGSVKLDAKWGAGDLLGLAKDLAELDPQRVQTHALPVRPHRTSGGADVVLLDEAAAAPVLDIFRGTVTPAPVTTTTVPPPEPGDLSVRVVNSSAADGEGRRVSYVLGADGFGIARVMSGESPHERTFIAHAKGQRAAGELLSGWITPTPELRLDKTLRPGQLVLDLGSDFEKVYRSVEGSNAEHGPGPVGGDDGSKAGGTGNGGSTNGDSEGGTATTTPTTTTTTQPGWTPGVPPAGVECR